MDRGLEFQVSGSGHIGEQGSGFRVYDLGFRDWCLGFRV